MRRMMIGGFAESLPELKRSELVSKSYRFELITPMFGGDVKSFEINERTPIRSQSIKGQLRFWWRTMQGFTSKDDLLKTETKIWGGSLAGEKCQSKVKVSVTEFKNLAVCPIEKGYDRNGNPRRIDSPLLAPYVLFPALKIENVKLLSKASFTLTVTCPQNIADDVKNTIALWTLFGGVGGRTRRGCGSVYSEEVLNDVGIASIADVKNLISKIGAGGSGELPYARIKGAKLFFSKANGSIRELQKKYGDYRQDRKPAPPGTNHPGRSYWPEPDAIRRILRKNAQLHEPEHPDGNWFPRAAFGLPVMTHYNTSEKGRGDPEGTIKLEPADKIGGKNAQRWPSPYFIKQLKLKNELFNVMFFLNQKFPTGLLLDGRIVPPSGLPSNTQGKKMNTNPSKPEYRLNGRTITKALADALGMEEA